MSYIVSVLNMILPSCVRCCHSKLLSSRLDRLRPVLHRHPAQVTMQIHWYSTSSYGPILVVVWMCVCVCVCGAACACPLSLSLSLSLVLLVCVCVCVHSHLWLVASASVRCRSDPLATLSTIRLHCCSAWVCVSDVCSTTCTHTHRHTHTEARTHDSTTKYLFSMQLRHTHTHTHTHTRNAARHVCFDSPTGHRSPAAAQIAMRTHCTRWPLTGAAPVWLDSDPGTYTHTHTHTCTSLGTRCMLTHGIASCVSVCVCARP